MTRAPLTAHHTSQYTPGVGSGQLAVSRLILSLLEVRTAESSICPSQVARAIDADEWRGLMAAVRLAAIRLAAAGIIEIAQQGMTVEPDGRWRGPIRLRRGPVWESRD